MMRELSPCDAPWSPGRGVGWALRIKQCGQVHKPHSQATSHFCAGMPGIRGSLEEVWSSVP